VLEFLSNPFLQAAYLPVLVFVAEMCVVTLCTIRFIFIARGKKVLASLLGFFEITIWLFAIGQIMQNLTNISCFLGFAGGFTFGNYLGILIEKKLALGNLVVHITTHKDPTDLIASFKAASYGVTTINARGTTGPVQVIFTVIKRKELDQIVGLIKRFDPSAFYSVNDLQAASRGIFPAPRSRPRLADLAPMRTTQAAA
jgi:uncharacterized protein YebE (UPF0316 family)